MIFDQALFYDSLAKKTSYLINLAFTVASLSFYYLHGFI